MKKRSEEEEERGGGPKVWDCGSPLYDAYELVSAANIIERHMMSLPSPFGFASSSLEFEEEACKKTTTTTNIVIRKKRQRGKAKGVKSRFYNLLARIGLIMMIKR